jgi:hypothetical protein
MKFKDEIQKKMLSNDFSSIEKLLNNASRDEIKSLIDIPFDTGGIITYTIVCMMLIKKETSELHYRAAQILFLPLCYLEGAYSAALYHIRRAIELAPKDKGLKELLIFLHEVPDQVVSKDEAISIARELLKEDSNNKPAQKLLKWYGLLKT